MFPEYKVAFSGDLLSVIDMAKNKAGCYHEKLAKLNLTENDFDKQVKKAHTYKTGHDFYESIAHELQHNRDRTGEVTFKSKVVYRDDIEYLIVVRDLLIETTQSDTLTMRLQ